MFRTFFSTVSAIIVLVLMSMTAFAGAADPVAPTVAPSLVPEPVEETDRGANLFAAQMTSMREQVKAVRLLLQKEMQMDQKMRSQIRALKDIGIPATDRIHAYEAELKPLTARLKALTQELKKAENTRGRKRDEAKISKLKGQITDVKAQIGSMNEKYKDLLAQIEKNKAERSRLKELRKKLQPMYATLRAKINEAKLIDRNIDRLVISVKAALAANDAGKAEGLVSQILSKLEALNANIAARITTREQMLDILAGYGS